MKCLCVPKLTQLCTIHELTSWNHPRLAPRNLLIVFSFENLDPNRVLGLLSEDAYTRSRVYYTLSKRAGQQQHEGRCSKTHEIGPTLTHIRLLWARAGARARASTHESHAPGQTHILPTTDQTTVYWDLEKRPRLLRGDGRFLERWLHLQPFVAAFSDMCSNLNFEATPNFSTLLRFESFQFEAYIELLKVLISRIFDLESWISLLSLILVHVCIASDIFFL